MVEPADLPADAPVVLILHGSKGNGDSVLALCDELKLPPCRFVLPDAPLPLGHSGMGEHFWYGRFTHSRKDIDYSRDYLFEVMKRFSRVSSSPSESLTQPKPRPVIVMGLSQGAVMALEAGLNYQGNVEAIVSMSGYLANPKKSLAHPTASPKTPILLVHGTWDPIVQNEDTQGTLQALRQAGYHPVLKEFQIGHVLTGGTLAAVSRFLNDVMSRDNQEKIK